MSATHHACFVCVTGTYRDGSHDHDAMCGRSFDPKREDFVANSHEGLRGMEGVECSECMVAFDEWAASRTQEQIDWNGDRNVV